MTRRPDVKQLGAFVTDTTDTGAGAWTAVASTPSVDRDGEVVDPWAFQPLPPSVPVHDGHRFDRVVGRATPRYDSRGVLWVDGTFSSIPEAQRTRTLVLEGVVNSMSVAFHKPTRRDGADGVTHVAAGDLLSVDFVTVPSQPEALVTSVRGFGTGWRDDDPRRAQLAAWQQRVDLLRLDLDALPRSSQSGRSARAVANFYKALLDSTALLENLNRRR